MIWVENPPTRFINMVQRYRKDCGYIKHLNFINNSIGPILYKLSPNWFNIFQPSHRLKPLFFTIACQNLLGFSGSATASCNEGIFSLGHPVFRVVEVALRSGPWRWKHLEHNISRWWQLKHFLFSPRTVGKVPILTNIFQLGWNHQLDFFVRHFVVQGGVDVGGASFTTQVTRCFCWTFLRFAKKKPDVFVGPFWMLRLSKWYKSVKNWGGNTWVEIVFSCMEDPVNLLVGVS